PQPAFGAVRRTRIPIAICRMVEAGDFPTSDARDEEIISRVIGRITGSIAHFIGDTPAAQMFAGARIGEVGGWKIHTPVTSFNDQASDAAIGELNRQRESHRTGAGD